MARLEELVPATYLPESNPAAMPQLNATDPIGHLSCVAYSFAYLIDAATRGAHRPTGAQVRALTHDAQGGLELSQCALVAQDHYGVECVTGVFSTALYEAHLGSGLWGAVMLIGYRPYGSSAYAGEPGGAFNHGVGQIQNRIVLDPLADGRRSGVYRYHGASYPAALIRAGVAALIVDRGKPHVAGPGWFEATLFRLPPAPPAPSGAGTLTPTGPATTEKNVMIAQTPQMAVTSNFVKHLVKGQPLFRSPGGAVVTRMSANAAVDYMGGAGAGWHAVKVSTGAPYVDHAQRPTVLYVPLTAGPVTLK